MELTQQRRIAAERRVVETIIHALENDTLSIKDLPTVSSFILSNMKGVKTHEDLINFLRELSAKWNIFSPVLVVESGEAKEQKEEKVAEKVESLTASGNIDEALSVAKAATAA